MPTTPRPLGPAAQLWNLFLMELTNWRWSWRWMVLTGTLAPILSMLALSVFARDSGPEALAHVFSGNLVLVLVFDTLTRLTSRFSFMRFNGGLDYYATLPISNAALITATMLSFLVLTLPSLALTLAAGSLLLGIPLRLQVGLVLAIPLSALATSGIGAFIGARARNPQAASSISFLVSMLLMGLGPVMVPASRLPAVMVWLGYLSPATYAASALRQCLLGPSTLRLALDLAALAAFTSGNLWLVSRTLNWRGGG